MPRPARSLSQYRYPGLEFPPHPPLVQRKKPCLLFLSRSSGVPWWHLFAKGRYWSPLREFPTVEFPEEVKQKIQQYQHQWNAKRIHGWKHQLKNLFIGEMILFTRERSPQQRKILKHDHAYYSQKKKQFWRALTVR